MTIPRRRIMKAPKTVPTIRNKFLNERLDFDELGDEDVAAGAAVVVLGGAAVVDVDDATGFAREKEEVEVGEPVEEAVSVEETLDDPVVVAEAAEGESMELSSESPKSSSCCILFVEVAAAAVVVAAPFWAKVKPYNTQKRAT
jgi:hypothetical protein